MHFSHSLIDSLLQVVESAPSDPVLIFAMNKLSQMRIIQKASPYFITRVTNTISNQSKLNQNQLNQDFIFNRINPLLLLKTLPICVWSDDNQDPQVLDHLCNLLFDRMTGEFEFDDVRKLSAELCARLPFYQVFDRVIKELSVSAYCVPFHFAINCNIQEAVTKSNFLIIKVFLFCICNLVLIRGENIIANQLYSRYVPLLFQLLQVPYSHKELEKVQMGCIDCMALTIKSGFQYQFSQQKDEQQQQEQPIIISNLIQQIITNINSGTDSFRICMINTCTSACKYLALKELLILVRYVIQPLYKIVMMMANISYPVQCASLQSLMHMSVKIGTAIHPYSNDLLHATLHALKSPSDMVRLSGLKLLSALLVARDDMIVEYASLFMQVQKQLHSISLMDTHAQVRQLAHQLVKLIVPSEGGQ